MEKINNLQRNELLKAIDIVGIHNFEINTVVLSFLIHISVFLGVVYLVPKYLPIATCF